MTVLQATQEAKAGNDEFKVKLGNLVFVCLFVCLHYERLNPSLHTELYLQSFYFLSLNFGQSLAKLSDRA